MIPLFLGLTAANLLLMSLVFVIGLGATDGDAVTPLYTWHITLAIASGMIATLTHIVIYTYFMATSKWLRAATEKGNLDADLVARPGMRHKRRALPIVMTPIVLTMLTMFAGAAADPTVRPWWPGEVHMVIAAATIAANLACAFLEYGLINAQSALMDKALGILNRTPGVVIQEA